VVPEDCITKSDQWVLLCRKHAEKLLDLHRLVDRILSEKAYSPDMLTPELLAEISNSGHYRAKDELSCSNVSSSDRVSNNDCDAVSIASSQLLELFRKVFYI
jgi:hypothetical protein